MPTKSGQKFVGQNRAPRVQVEYDVELYGAQKKVNLPFVVGVMSELSGKPKEPLARLEERSFVDIDADNFDERLKSMKPRVAMQVPNLLTGEGNLAVDISFDSMDDFSPDKVAEKVAGLKEIFDARKELSNLLSYMDGKVGAEELVGKLLENPALLKAISAKAKEKTE